MWACASSCLGRSTECDAFANRENKPQKITLWNCEIWLALPIEWLLRKVLQEWADRVSLTALKYLSFPKNTIFHFRLTSGHHHFNVQISFPSTIVSAPTCWMNPNILNAFFVVIFDEIFSEQWTKSISHCFRCNLWCACHSRQISTKQLFIQC